MDNIAALVAALSNLLDSCQLGAKPAIDVALSQLCPLIEASQTLVYFCADDSLFTLAYRSPPTAQDHSGAPPLYLPTRLVSAWRGDNADHKPLQILSADFLDPGTDTGCDACPHETFILIPMVLQQKCVGVIGYAVSGAHSDSEVLMQTLRDLTNIMQPVLAKLRTADAVGTQGPTTPTRDSAPTHGVGTEPRNEDLAVSALVSAADAAHIRLTNAIHALPDSIVIFDANQRLVAVNAAYHRAFPAIAEHAVAGVKLADLLKIGLEKGAFLDKPTEAEKWSWLEGRLSEYCKAYSEDEVQLPDGRWMHRVNTRTSDGGIIAMGFDITAKRNQIAALDAANSDLRRLLVDRDRAEQQLRGVIDGAAVGIWEIDTRCDKLHLGGHWGEIIGCETSKLNGLSVDDFVAMVHPEDKAKILDAQDFDPDSDNKIRNTEFRMRHADGHWVWILSRCRVSERAADGTLLRISGVHLDVSEQKQLEQDAFASRAFLLDVMDASNSAIVVLDDGHQVSYVNHEAERVMGLFSKIEPGQNFDLSTLKLLRADGTALPEDESPFNLALRAAQPLRDVQIGFLHHDGGRGILAFNAALLDKGEQQFGVVSFSDITERLAATQSLQDALARAEEMSRAKSTFLANMSHEIRTPLNGVLGMAEVLADIVSEPLQRQMVDTIRKSGETLLTVLNAILDMSKIEAGKMALEQAPFVPLDLIRKAEAIYAIAAEENGVEFEVLATAGCDKPRLGDAHRLMQVLHNLLNNAFKFTETGKVTLKVSCRSGKPVQIEVSDTGIGMDAMQVSRVFESFVQADGSMTRRFGGTGLGLSIARQLVTLMGGTISAESTPGVGSIFRIVLPLPDAESAPSSPNKSMEISLREDALADVRILTADDNATNRLVLSEMLAKTGAIVSQVENGQDAIDTWLSALESGSPFALLLLDITMPVLDGVSALAKIRYIEAARALPRVFAVAVTAHAMPSQIADYLIGGFDSHLAKPFRRADLLHTLHSLLSN
ncbi:ATP-binding protein [Cypionkella sp.]|uniref:PAS domain-containing hybrid sensor histidine kinase/response regulator n=1 Tax=Cypionkella sp. TaxID=2811411 RepID=UPI00260427E5|nr:ATP-binding protein [Cypionkella sp.]